MVSILMTILGVGINAETFVGNNSAFGKSGRGDVIAEGRRHDLAGEKVQKSKDK